MTGATVTDLESFRAPYGRDVRLQEYEYESGMRLLRVTIREGRRITTLELDADTASRWGSSMMLWAERSGSRRGGG